MIAQEDFDAWRDNPVTQAVMAYVARMAESAKAEWIDACWEDRADPSEWANLMAKAKQKYQTSYYLVDLTLEHIERDE